MRIDGVPAKKSVRKIEFDADEQTHGGQSGLAGRRHRAD